MRKPDLPALALVVAAVAGVSSCAGPPASDAPARPTRPAAAQASVSSAVVPNLRRVTATIYSSGKPEGDAAFRELASIGIRTVISVDGEKPDVEAARRAGLRYVHLPLNYSGIPEQRALELAKAVRDLPGPVLIHCHHGKHRAPAAAAVARLAVVGGTNDEAVAEMKAAGTDPHFEGLYSSVAGFKKPSATELDAVACTFPEIAPPRPFVDAMVELDHRFDRLDLGKPREGDFAHEALLLRESLVELRRSSAEREATFKQMLDASIEAAAALEDEARKGQPSRGAIQRLKQSCTRCHEQSRDR